MKQGNFRQLTVFSTHIQHLKAAGPVALVLVLALSVLLNLGLVVIPNPALATIGAIVTVFILPGWLLAELIYDRQDSSWPERVPAAFVLGLGLLGPPAVLLLERQASLAALGWISAGLNLVLVLLYLRQRPKQAPGSTVEPIQPILLAAVLLAGAGALLLFLVTASTWSFGDNWSYLLYIRHYLDRSLTPPVDPMLGQAVISRRVIFNTWWVLQAYLFKVAAVEPVAGYSFYLPPLFMVLSLLAFYGLANTLFQNRNTVLLAVLVQLVYCLTSIGSHDWIGRGFFDRILEDKFLIWLILLPATTMLMLRYLASGRARQLLPLVLGIAALALTHPMGLVQAGLSWGVFAPVYWLFNRRRVTLIRFVFIFLPLLLFLLVPLLQRQMLAGGVTGVAFDYAGGEDIQLALNRTRLWIFSAAEDRYMAHPQLVSHPLAVLAVLLTPLLIGFLRQSLAAQFLFSNMAGILLLLYNPLTAPLLGNLITPWMLWRVAWLLPVALTITFFLNKLVDWLPQPARRPVPAGPAALLLAAIVPALLLWPYVRESIGLLRERRDYTMRPAERELLVYLREQAASGSTVMARPELNTYVPAFTGSVRVLTFRWLGKPLDRADVERFYRAKWLDMDVLEILQRQAVEYLVIERQHPLAFQLERRPALFTRRYQNALYSLYQLRPDPAPDRVITGNTYLLQGEWSRAENAYRAALAARPDDAMARTGLGQALQRQGRAVEAVAAYEQALGSDPDYLPARLALAGLYTDLGQPGEAERQYQLAAAEQPDQPAIFKALGDLYLARSQPEQALAAYRQAIDLPPGRPAYSLALAGLLQAQNLPEQAESAYRATLALNPAAATAASAYAGLGQLYQAQGRLEAAEAAYRQAIDMAPDNRYYYYGLKTVYQAGSRVEELPELYRAAARRNLNAAWPHVEMGQIYLSRVD